MWTHPYDYYLIPIPFNLICNSPFIFYLLYVFFWVGFGGGGFCVDINCNVDLHNLFVFLQAPEFQKRFQIFQRCYQRLVLMLQHMIDVD